MAFDLPENFKKALFLYLLKTFRKPLVFHFFMGYRNGGFLIFWEEMGKHELSNMKPCVPPDFHLGILKEGKLTHTFSTPP